MKSTNNTSNYEIKPFSDITDFHGHVCPGSAIGYKAAEIAIKELSSKRDIDEEFVCITENDTCAVDAIQVITGCTFGKGNLIFKDYGKHAYTFINRETKEALRISMKNSFSIYNIDPNLSKLREKVNSGKASDLEKEELKKSIIRVSDEIIKLPGEEIFNVEQVKAEIPQKARIFKSLKCHECGEVVSKHRTKEIDEDYFCIPCYLKLDEKVK